MKILVAAGGLSPERDVSLASGALIANALLDNGHQVALADIYSAVPCSGDGTPSADLFFRKDSGKRFSYTIAQQQPDIEALIRANGGRRDQVGPGFLALCRQADIVFVALHGGIGENGGFQALMETFGIRHTGSGSEGCALSMDKSIAKILAAAAGIQTPPAVFLPTELSAGEAAARAAQETGFPCVIKPCGCGSSIGVSVVKNEAEALQAVSRARIYGTACLAEKKIEGRRTGAGRKAPHQRASAGGNPAQERVLRLCRKIPGGFYAGNLPGGPFRRRNHPDTGNCRGRPSGAPAQGIFPQRLHPGQQRRILVAGSQHPAGHDANQPRSAGSGSSRHRLPCAVRNHSPGFACHPGNIGQIPASGVNFPHNASHFLDIPLFYH